MNSHRESQRMLPSVLCARSRKTHLYQFPFISNQAAQLVTVPSWIVSIFILAALSIYFCMNSSGGENITKSSKTTAFLMIVRASVAECLVRFASVLQISRWKLRHPTEAVLARTGSYSLVQVGWGKILSSFWRYTGSVLQGYSEYSYILKCSTS